MVATKFIARVLPMIAVAVIFTGCVGNKDNQDITGSQSEIVAIPNDENLSKIPPSSLDSQIETRLNQAINAALENFSDAKLSYVEIKISSTMKKDIGQEVYAFSTDTDDSVWWTYSVEQSTGKFVRAIIPKEDFLGFDIPAISLDFWDINYVEALQKAEANGGAGFRSSNSGTIVSAVLMHRQPRGWLWWTIEYTSSDGNNLIRLVNPGEGRGEVLDESGNELSPAEELAPVETEGESVN